MNVAGLARRPGAKIAAQVSASKIGGRSYVLPILRALSGIWRPSWGIRHLGAKNGGRGARSYLWQGFANMRVATDWAIWQVIDKAAFVDPNVQNSHQNDDYPRWQMGGMRDSGARYPTHGSEIVKVDPAGAEHQRCSD